MSISDDEFERLLQQKRSGGIPLDIGVSRAVWMGGIRGERPHAPVVFVGAEGWDGDAELTFLPNREAVESLITRLREASRAAFGDVDDER